uniref:MI domain-containing protein n=1 Tax=Biomphalaria glabrata TaxID=6526 RepID=A0A2C9LFQ9_BIOGL
MTKPWRTKMPPLKSMSRKERRKEERKLKKARKDAFAHRNYDRLKDLKDLDTAFKAKNQQEKKERLKVKEKKKKVAQVEAKKEQEDTRVKGLKLAIQKDEKELKQLEKNLKFRKKKGVKNLPSSFMKDGLDYILDVTDSEKIKTLEDVVPGYVKGSDDDDDSESDNEMNLKMDTEIEEESGSDDDEADQKSSNESKDIQKALNPIIKQKNDPAKKDSKKVSFASTHLQSKTAGKNMNFSDDDDDDNDEEEEEDEDFDEGEEGESDELEEFLAGEDDDDDELENKPSRKRPREEADNELREDVYGRLRDREGNIVKPTETGTYIPPAKRLLLSAGQNEALHKKLKGLINKVSEGSMQAISSQIEALYLDNSRADVNETMFAIILESVVTPVACPERLVTELTMLITILSCNIGSEVGAIFIQKLAKKFDDLLREPDYGHGKLMENVLLLIANLYNFKLFHSKLVFDIMDKFVSTFNERDIEVLLLLLKTVGFKLRKDDPLRLKQVILDIQAKARAAESSSGGTMQSRIRFMLDILMAVRNNNMRKIPNYDSSHIEHLKKIIKTFIKVQGEDELNISLEDLLKADQIGRWWIVGSAWEGRKDPLDSIKEAKSKTETSLSGTFSKQMMKLAKQQGMNTEIRRHIFCILGTSEDYEDAFARLIRMGLNHSQEREIIHVLLHCCLNEKEYNPFYGYLAEKFCVFDRRFMITIQFSIWDKFKEVDKLDKLSRNKLGRLISHLLIAKALSLSIFKVIEFGMESKKMIRLLVHILTEIFTSCNETSVHEIFERIAPFPKLKTLRQGLQVFMRIHFKETKGQAGALLQERIEKADSAMFSHQTSNMLL